MRSVTGSSAASSPGQLAALQAAAYAENAAIFGYSAAGAHLGGAQRTSAQEDYDGHRAQLLVVAGWIQSSSATPSPAAPAYQLPYPVTTAAAAVRLLTSLEESVAAAYADVVATTTSDLQRAAALALQVARNDRGFPWPRRPTSWQSVLMAGT
jgi:hypothetical protein